MSDLRQEALTALLIPNPPEKCARVAAILKSDPVDTKAHLCPPDGAKIPGIPPKPEFVDPRKVPQRQLSTVEGRAIMMHSIAHIEFNAINLALDIMWRFPDMPEDFYRDWLQVAHEEVKHYGMIVRHMESMGYTYGDFPAHRGLWDMAEKTQDNLLARLALVPRYLEARGLDVNPVIQDKFRAVGDQAAVDILEVILREEVGHVAYGDRWFKYVCERQGLAPEATYRALFDDFQVGRPKGQMNVEARRRAGFSDEELQWLQNAEKLTSHP